MTVLVNSIDFDNCLGNLLSVQPGGLIGVFPLYYSNIFFMHIKHQIARNSIKKIYTVNGSNRQAQDIESQNGARHSYISCTQGLTVVTQALAKYLQRKVSLFKLMLSDTAHAKPIGTNFNLIWQYHNDFDYEKVKDMLNDYPFSRNKSPIIFMQSHLLAQHLPKQKIILDFYDDTIDILDTLKINFRNGGETFLPQQVTLRLWHFDGEKIPVLKDTIKGTGNIRNAAAIHKQITDGSRPSSAGSNGRRSHITRRGSDTYQSGGESFLTKVGKLTVTSQSQQPLPANAIEEFLPNNHTPVHLYRLPLNQYRVKPGFMGNEIFSIAQPGGSINRLLCNEQGKEAQDSLLR